MIDHIPEQYGDYSILVVGAGSIGRRHVANLQKLGILHISVCDPDSKRLAEIADELAINRFNDFERAVETVKPNMVFICTPPVYHVSQALSAVRSGSHVFLEKPLSNSLDGVDLLISESERHGSIVQVGYNWRFHPAMKKLKDVVRSGLIGRPLWAHAEVAQFLPDWRPWQDYRQSYTARKELGGGIILDGSHEIDYVTWILGKPEEVMCMAGKVSDLEVDVEDCATVLLRFAGGMQADIHLDFVQRGYSRKFKLAGELGTLQWDFTSHILRTYLADSSSVEELQLTSEINQMYVDEVAHFLHCVAHKKTPCVDLMQSRDVLLVALAALESANNGRSIRL
jgi:predicted dehydrogenase